MDIKNTAIVNPDITCCSCLKEYDRINEIHINALGYGSAFDGCSTRLNLCDECYKQTNPEWWKLRLIDDEWEGHYEYENEILDYVGTLPLAGQELFKNRYDAEYYMEPQDWIDYELEILPHEKCKSYGRYSIDEIKAYQNRFPTCDKVYKKVYKDGSAGCWCPRKAHGNADGSCSANTSTECYMCTKYSVRKGVMNEINELDDFIKHEKRRLNEMLEYATKNIKLLNENPMEYFKE